MPNIRHLATVILVLSVCGSIGAQEYSVPTDQTFSVDSTEHIGISATITGKQHYLDSLSVVFSGRNLHIYNDTLLRSISYTSADSAGHSMRAVLSSRQGNTMQTALSMGTFSTGIDYVAVASCMVLVTATAVHGLISFSVSL